MFLSFFSFSSSTEAQWRQDLYPCLALLTLECSGHKGALNKCLLNEFMKKYILFIKNQKILWARHDDACL
jgi:hypothetical protein